MRLAVVGAGWAGLACAVEAVRQGHAVTVFEAAPNVGGRARRVDDMHGMALDNGQHILIGAYSATLQLMRDVGVDPERALLRLPLSLRFADGGGTYQVQYEIQADFRRQYLKGLRGLIQGE